MSTKIEWCHETWNPITGCSPISEGCKNCYARRMAQRLKGRFGYPEDEPFQIVLHSLEVLNRPLKWKKARKIFVCSMGDLFHELIPEWMITQVMDRVLYDGISHHTFMLLTKRPQRMKEYFKSIDNMQNSFENVWLGVTAENQKCADERIPILLQIPAAVRFVSVEPMLNVIDIRQWIDPYRGLDYTYRNCIKNHLISIDQAEALKVPTIDWVIAGPETGPGKRECKPEWIRDLYEQCKAAGVPFFDKTKKNWIAREFPT